MTTQLAEQIQPLRDRQSIVQALKQIFHLVSHNPQLESDISRLFQGLYPDSPFQPGTVKLVKTASALVFCLPFNEQALPGWNEITQADIGSFSILGTLRTSGT